MKKVFYTLNLIVAISVQATAQYAPQVGILGSTAIHKSDAAIQSWATKCQVQRGWQDIANPSGAYTSVGDSTKALGKADGEIVSLGDSGIAVLQFEAALYNGLGADFAVFENGFANPANPEEAFLELAFVEVSSDGEHFFRFPASSNTPNTTQIKGAGEYMDARLIHNLAGKYIAQNGTPFDLEDLKGTTGLDIDNISHIRIIDVVGTIDETHASKDASGQIINDPYPTAFPTGGFDLDAIAAIHIKPTRILEIGVQDVSIFPNPSTNILNIDLANGMDPKHQLHLMDASGKTIIQISAQQHNKIDVSTLQSGIYFLGLQTETGMTWIGKCTKI